MFTDESFLAPDFDESSYLRHALQVSSTSFETEQLRLSRCLEKIETEIHSTVQTNRDALIGSVQEVSAAQRTTNAVLGTVDQLSSSVRRMRHTIHEPYLQMEQRVHELRNVHACLSLVRNVQRYLSCSSKLKEAVSGDLVRAARLLKEMEEIQSSCDFTGISFIDAITPGLNQAANAIRQRLSEALRAAINTSNPGELAVSLQCAASMNSLTKTTQGLLAEIKREASRALVKELDNASSVSSSSSSSLSGGVGGGPINEMDASFREAIFTSINKALHQVGQQLRSFGLLWTVLRKRRDPSNDMPYWWQLPNSERKSFDGVWTSILNQIKERMTKLSKRGSVLVAVSSEYGRLNIQLRAFLNSARETLGHVYFDGDDADESLMQCTIDDVVSKLSNDFEPRFKLSLQDRFRERMSGLISKLTTMRPPAGVAESTTIDVKADIRLQLLSSHQNAHGGSPSSSSPLHSSSVAAASSTRNAPAMVVHPVASTIDPKNFFKTVSNEITAARNDDAVLSIVLQAVCDEIETFWKKSQESLKQLQVPDLPKISAGSTTALQLFHIQLANACSAFALEMQSLGAMLPVVTSSSLNSLNTTNNNSNINNLEKSMSRFHSLVENINTFTCQIVQPYFNAAQIVLFQTVDNFVQDYYERGVARGSSSSSSGSPHQQQQQQQSPVNAVVKARIADFAARYGLLFDARAGTVAARSCYILADKILQRFVVRMLLRRGVQSPSNTIANNNSDENDKNENNENNTDNKNNNNFDLAKAKFVAEDISAIQDAVNILHPLDRLARRLSQLRAIRSICLASTADELDKCLNEQISSKFHPVVILLAMMQFIPPAAAPSLHSQLKITVAQLTIILETLLNSSPGMTTISGDEENNFNNNNLSMMIATPAVISTSSGGLVSSSVPSSSLVKWDSAKYTVLWEACNVLVGQMESSGGGICDEMVIRRARRVVDSLRP